MLKKKIFFLVFLVSILLSISVVFSSIEVFTNYNTKLIINNDSTITVLKNLTLKNVYKVGIVPGQIEFKIGTSDSGQLYIPNESYVSAYDEYGNKIDTSLRRTKDFTTIILNVYYPLLPGFSYSFVLKYRMIYHSNGIFFKSLEIPLRESTIPIENGKFIVILPKKYGFSYVKSTGISKYTIHKNVAVWNVKNNNPKSITFEYSIFPIRLFDLRGSYIFWIGLNFLLFLFLVYEIRKEIQTLREKEEDYEDNGER